MTSLQQLIPAWLLAAACLGSEPTPELHNTLQHLLDRAAANGESFDGKGRHYTSDLPVNWPPKLTAFDCTIEVTPDPDANPRLQQPAYFGSFGVQDLARVEWHDHLQPEWDGDDIVVWRSVASYTVNGHPTPFRLLIDKARKSRTNPFAPQRGVVANMTSGKIGHTPGLPHVPLGFIRDVALINVKLIAAGEGFGMGRCGVVGLYTEGLEIDAANPGPSNGVVDGLMVNTRVQSTRCALEAAIGCQNLVIRGWFAQATGDSTLRNLALVKLGQSCVAVRVRDLFVDGTGGEFLHAVRTTEASGCSISGAITTDRDVVVSEGGCDLSGLTVYGGRD